MPGLTFYLSSHDYVSTPAPRTCTYIGDCASSTTTPQLWRVEIAPPLPGELVGLKQQITELLLGAVDPALGVRDIGKRQVIVDIYVAKDRLLSQYLPEDLRRIGCGRLHATLAEATGASPLHDENL